MQLYLNLMFIYMFMSIDKAILIKLFSFVPDISLIYGFQTVCAKIYFFFTISFEKFETCNSTG